MSNWNPPVPRLTTPTRICRQCGKVFHPTHIAQAFCSECDWGGDREPRIPTKPLLSPGETVPNGTVIDQSVGV